MIITTTTMQFMMLISTNLALILSPKTRVKQVIVLQISRVLLVLLLLAHRLGVFNYLITIIGYVIVREVLYLIILLILFFFINIYKLGSISLLLGAFYFMPALRIGYLIMSLSVLFVTDKTLSFLFLTNLRFIYCE